MNKYILVFQNTFSEYLAYRINFILWRVRVIISILISYFLWQTVFKAHSILLGYQQTTMLTYILLMTFLNSVVFSTQTFRIASEIHEGALSNFLLQPINIFGFNFARDLADKCINIVASVIELILFFIILKPPFFYQTNSTIIFLFCISMVFATILYFCINVILSSIGFWSRESWAPRFVFFILVTFLAGTYFPLDIVPPFIYSILRLLPFTYLIYFPLKIYLGTFSYDQIIFGFIMQIVWTLSLYFLMKKIWRSGLKLYTAEGR